MRTLLFLLVSLLSLSTVLAQDNPLRKSKGLYRTFFLPDGSAVNGRIIERLSGDSIAVESTDGEIYQLSKTQSQRIKRAFERTPRYSANSASTEAGSVANWVPVPMQEEPRFRKGASQFSADLLTHFSSNGSDETADPESGIVASLSYLYGVAPQFKVGGGVGIMTVKSGSKERVFPLFARAEYQFLPKISATLNAGYGLIPTNETVLDANNGLYGNATIAFDLVGPESAYTSRIGFGIVTQYLELGRTEIVRESTFGGSTTYSQYVERTGWMRRMQITFTHAWRLPSTTMSREKKSKN